MTDVLTKEQRKKNMSAIRSTHTKLEDKVTNELWKRGLRFRKNVKDLKGKPDIAIKKYKTVIFIDSCFWHGCELHGHIPKSNIEFWESKIHRNKARDLETTLYYTNKDWHVLRIWEHEINADINSTIERIIEFVYLAQRMIR
ncbi:very short patch repair endonuclease [Paenibacillus aestuarii]|uniref:Very short patch repair endonuclease n=1 Tax=Paenibacillus aestuarii TaxID=516965 RepID=A0ABW0KFG5_9BACL|nr:very short patch repair endonuclease [Paenibacillus aestuarii]